MLISEGITPTDADLVQAARNGDAASFGVLFERHHVKMRAVAISVLGWSAAVDDVIQDAILVAMRRVGDLRDPAAVGRWLCAIVRNAALMQLRTAAREQPLLDREDWRAPEPTPEEVIDGHALRDWVWSALETLPEALRVTVMLRHFTGAHSYQDIAEVCGVPVGTVRSRLSEARRRLTATLKVAADTAHGDAGIVVRQRSQDAMGLIAAMHQGEFEQTLADLAVPEMDLVGPQRQRFMAGPRGQALCGQEALLRIAEEDLGAGVRQRPLQVTASSDITILECEIVSPAWDPGHCPPAVLWLMRLRDGRVDQIRLFHPTRSVPASAA